jgi:hypothetical protein
MFEQPHTLLVRWKRNQTCGLTRTYEQSFKPGNATPPGNELLSGRDETIEDSVAWSKE